MIERSRTTFYRDNHNEDIKKFNRKTIAIIIFVAAPGRHPIAQTACILY